MIRDNIRNDVKVTMNGEVVSAKTIKMIPFAKADIDDISCYVGEYILTAFANNLAVMSIIPYNGKLWGYCYYRFSGTEGIKLNQLPYGTRPIEADINSKTSVSSFVEYHGLIHGFDDESLTKTTPHHILDEDGNIVYTYNNAPNTRYGDDHGKVIVYNDTLYMLIYFIGSTSSSSNYTGVFMWNGENDDTWTTVSNYILIFTALSNAVVYNGTIHIISGVYYSGSYNNKYHYSFDGTTWTRVSTPPIQTVAFRRYSPGLGNDSYVFHNNLYFQNYMWSDEDSTWVDVGMITLTAGSIVVPVNDTEIHAFIYSGVDSLGSYFKHYCNYSNVYSCTIDK